MILIIEPMCKGMSHTPFNSALLAIVMKAFPEERIIFYSDGDHCNEIKNRLIDLSLNNISFYSVEYPPRKCGVLYDLICEIIMYRKIFKSINTKECQHILVTSANAVNLIALKLVVLIMSIKVQIKVIMHSPLTELAFSRSFNPIKRYTDFRSAILAFKVIKNIEYIVLDEIVRINLQNKLPMSSLKVKVLEHPIPLDRISEPLLRNDGVLRFAFVGAATKEKGFDAYLRFVDKLQDKYSNISECFILGSVSNDWARMMRDVKLANRVSSEKIPRNELISLAEKVQYVCLFYNEEHYNLCASGALLDAIGWEKPIIANRIPLFTNIFNKYGEIGYLYEDENDIITIVEKIMTDYNNKKYLKYINNIKQIKIERGIDNLAKHYFNTIAQ